MFFKTLREIRRYPSAIVGLALIAILVITAIYAVIAVPYKEAVLLWRGSENMWYRNPQIVPPAWTNWFRHEKLPETIYRDSREDPDSKTKISMSEGTQYDINLSFDYNYDDFPKDIVIYFYSTYIDKQPFVDVTLMTPDGREQRILNGAISSSQTLYFSQDQNLMTRYGDFPFEAILAAPDTDPAVPLKGTYSLHVSGVTFEEGGNIDAEIILYGKVFGVAGTDNLRRDLSVALLWGVPIALIFGLLAAIGTTFTTMFIAATGTWFGGWLDEAIQRITEVNLVLPFLPIIIMIGTFYSRSIWAILGATVVLGIFGGGIKTFRANFMQIKESPYIEAARAYGAGNWRIIFRYLTPRLIPLIIPQLVGLIPGYVFLEATLAVLGLGDPVLPTWGKVIQNAYANGALYMGWYFWILEPAALLVITGLSFALVGFALDRIFNPRLRTI